MSTSLFLQSVVAHQWHCDHFGHLNVRHYAAAFDDAVFIFWGKMGLQVPAKNEPGFVPVTAETKLTFQNEVNVGQIVSVYAAISRIGSKSVSLKFEMKNQEGTEVLATCETIEVFFDVLARQSAAIPAHIRQQLTANVS
ncbi:thioesterase family protein [Leeia sp. TBRC 13508]|uniref:Thioesterase family protein n=1 Tax=Leeia speluncae TaxID=2884804 RepID=A0ABS8DAX9_9NEIS|nr:thioesterase family protein [Leeia speluncae]MCB6185377.1 thioesterase family protein [Leeia speluncae]